MNGRRGNKDEFQKEEGLSVELKRENRRRDKRKTRE